MKKEYFMISHNEYAEGLKKAVEMIIGKQDNLTAYGLMPGEHPDEITAKIEQSLNDQTKTVILGDIAGGSVCNSALRLTTNPNVTLVTGTNLPLALEVIVSQATTEEEIAPIMKVTKEQMKILKVEPTLPTDGDDFFS
ncbi:MAG TPA: PTS sugar transporter subunit IIA [Candidatus Tetragenococcus pullicola]|nr:PTS sugar transporter subunit IIA [Candidatus Tetragenococcus pullicola]